MTMTKEQFAEMLDGRKIGIELTNAESELAKENGLVVVFGGSDDLMIFEGAIRDDIDCFGGGTAYLNEYGIWRSECYDEECPYAEREQVKCKTIKAIWRPGDSVSWEYMTYIPHATFRIYEKGELYCIGIVFELDALKR